MIKGLHHNAYRCRDSEETRQFYEGFLGLPLAGTLEITETKTGRDTRTLHTFYEMGNGSYLAFFEAPDMPFEFKAQHDFDLHIALEVDEATLKDMFTKGKAAGIETRGIIDHHFIHSIYFRDPNGYVIELTAKTPAHARDMDPATNEARAKLDRWQAVKRSAVA
jgi:catechol 2,3-dioxygenase-like lactoylglutathione lyase family enzyme